MTSPLWASVDRDGSVMRTFSDARGSVSGRRRNVLGISETGSSSHKLASSHEELLSVNVPLENSHAVASGNFTCVGP